MKPQAIAGVSAGVDREIETVYPSVAATGLGRLIGGICNSIPIRVGGVKLSALIFGLPMGVVALVPYILLKLFGKRYVLTNRAVRIKSALGERLDREVALGEIGDVAVDVQAGQSFVHAGDLILLKASGDEIVRLPGVPRPQRFRQIILDARDARTQNDASLATIQSRQPQPA